MMESKLNNKLTAALQSLQGLPITWGQTMGNALSTRIFTQVLTLPQSSSSNLFPTSPSHHRGHGFEFVSTEKSGKALSFVRQGKSFDSSALLNLICFDEVFYDLL